MIYNITDSRKSIQHEHGILLSILHNDEAAHKKSFSQKAIKMTRLAADIDIRSFSLLCIAHWQSGWPTAPKV